MTRKLYNLQHPLYPHHDLLKYHNDHKIVYHPYQGAYDDAYNQWYQLVRADHDFSGAPLRPITREISQIIRLKSSGQEFYCILRHYSDRTTKIIQFHSFTHMDNI